MQKLLVIQFETCAAEKCKTSHNQMPLQSSCKTILSKQESHLLADFLSNRTLFWHLAERTKSNKERSSYDLTSVHSSEEHILNYYNVSDAKSV